MLAPQRLIKVLMVFPEFPPSFWSFDEAVKLMRLKATMPPTGLATVAAMLPADRFEVLPIIDLNVEPLTDEVLQSADLVMFSAMIVQKDSLREIIRRVKGWGKTVVVGGPYATSYRDEVLAMGADHLVLDEAEVTLEPFVVDFLAGKAVKIYDEKTVVDRVLVPLTTEGKPLLVSTPVPRFDLLKLPRYSSLAVQYSRGCPFNCDFCNVTVLFGHKSRTKTPAQMIAELEAILATGWRGSIFIVDDNFIGNAKQVREFLPVLIHWQQEHGRPFSFFTEGSVNLANENMADIRDMMVMAGFTDVFVGIESTNLDVLRDMNKGQNIKGDLGDKVYTLQQAGLEVTAGFIIGNDGDRATVFDDLFQFIQDNGIVIAMAGLLTALHGTKLYKRLLSEGRLRAESSGNNTHGFGFNFEPVLDEKFLIDGYVTLLERLFSPENYFARCMTLRKRRGKHPRCGNINGSWPRATAIVFYRNLIRRPSWAFVKFMFRTLVFSPMNMPEAVTQAVKFEHFRKITRAAASAYWYPKKVETLLERFQRCAEKLRGDADKRLHKLATLERKFLAKALKKYRALDPHFRTDARRAFADLRDRLQVYAATYRLQWSECSV